MTHNVTAAWPVGAFFAGCLLIYIRLNFPILFLDNPDAPIGYDRVLCAVLMFEITKIKSFVS